MANHLQVWLFLTRRGAVPTSPQSLWEHLFPTEPCFQHEAFRRSLHDSHSGVSLWEMSPLTGNENEPCDKRCRSTVTVCYSHFVASWTKRLLRVTSLCIYTLQLCHVTFRAHTSGELSDPSLMLTPAIAAFGYNHVPAKTHFPKSGISHIPAGHSKSREVSSLQLPSHLPTLSEWY